MKPAWARTANAMMHGLLAGLVFWAPNVLVHWATAHSFRNLDVIILTILLPATTYLFFRLVSRPARSQDDRLSLALSAVLGIWVIGPAMLTVSQIFCGRGLAQSDIWHFLVFGTILFPLFTFMMSTYDGSIFALLLTTLLLPMLANSRFNRKSTA